MKHQMELTLAAPAPAFRRAHRRQRLADAVHHEAVTELHRQGIDVLDEGMHIALGDLAAQPETSTMLKTD